MRAFVELEKDAPGADMGQDGIPVYRVLHKIPAPCGRAAKQCESCCL